MECVTLGKSFVLFLPQFSSLQNGNSDSTHFLGELQCLALKENSLHLFISIIISCEEDWEHWILPTHVSEIINTQQQHIWASKSSAGRRPSDFIYLYNPDWFWLQFPYFLSLPAWNTCLGLILSWKSQFGKGWFEMIHFFEILMNEVGGKSGSYSLDRSGTKYAVC